MKTVFRILFALLALFQSCKEKEIIKEVEQATKKENTEALSLNSINNSESEPQKINALQLKTKLENLMENIYSKTA